MLINRQLGDYLLVRRLAVGGQSEVFLALKQGPDSFARPLVLKAMPSRYRDDPRFLKLFFQEAFISARFSHPNLISVHDAKKVGDEHFMVMDFVSGQTVSDLAQRSYKADKALTINQVVQIVADAAAGLHYAHEFQDVDSRSYSIIHCDVSPQNLMVTYDGVVKVFDFGIARVIGGEDADIAGIGGGKYAYMSPEQCMGKAVDARSDIFSLGIILFELCTGYRLFRRPTRPEVIQAVIEGEIPRPGELSPEIPEFLEQCILKALARDPQERYQTARELRADLLEFIHLNEGHQVHEELGQHMRELFAKERIQIADVLRQAAEAQESSKPLGSVRLGELSPGWRGSADSSLEMEVSMLELLPASEAVKLLEETGEAKDRAEASEALAGEDGTLEAAEEDAAVDEFVEEPVDGEVSEGRTFEADKENDVVPIKITGKSDRTADFLETVELSRAEESGEAEQIAQETADYIEYMTGELARARRRQRWLVVAIVVLLVMIGGLGFAVFSGQNLDVFAEEAPIQLGTEL